VIATNFLLSLSLFFINTPRSAAAQVDGHQMYSGGSVVGKASTIDQEILLTHPLIFTGGGGKKCEIWRRFQHHWTLRW